MPGLPDAAPARRAKILTVSDGVVAGTREDRSGDALVGVLVAHGWSVVDRAVCADGTDTVARVLGQMCAGFHGLVATTGGTGFAPRDQTPEATARILDRNAPGLAEAMRAVNPLGRLSRGLAGTAGGAIVVNLPGSPEGCVEQLTAVLDVLGHAVDLLGDIPTRH